MLWVSGSIQRGPQMHDAAEVLPQSFMWVRDRHMGKMGVMGHADSTQTTCLQVHAGSSFLCFHISVYARRTPHIWYEIRVMDLCLVQRFIHLYSQVPLWILGHWNIYNCPFHSSHLKGKSKLEVFVGISLKWLVCALSSFLNLLMIVQLCNTSTECQNHSFIFKRFRIIHEGTIVIYVTCKTQCSVTLHWLIFLLLHDTVHV